MPHPLYFLLLLGLQSILCHALLRVRLNPSGVTVTKADPEFNNVWNLPATASGSVTFSGVTFSLTAQIGSVLKGSRYKLGWDSMPAYLGERTMSAGVSTDTTTGQSLTLTLSGMAAGSHSLVTYHNAWDSLPAVGPVAVTVNGNKVVSSLQQTIRRTSIWDAAASYVNFSVNSTSDKVTIVYSSVSSSAADKRVFLNGFELDSPDLKALAKLPSPAQTDLHVQDNNGAVVLSWAAPANGAASYDVYTAVNGGTLAKVASQQNGRTFTFSGLDTVNTYQWRVDAITSTGSTVTGRVWSFRTAILAFPGAEGYGRFAHGGRGGKVVKVTKLTDDGSVGTLRYALTSVSGPRIVVFDVGGEIKLTSRLVISNGFVTVAGQTAPGKGIVVTVQPFGVSGTEDVVIRHVARSILYYF
jgi:hypothetical protein